MKYIPHTSDDIKEMLHSIGANNIESLFSGIPLACKDSSVLNIPKSINEMSLHKHIETIANKNAPISPGNCFLGAGAYHHYIPATVSELASRSEFLTPYTPYQPELSQGTLQVLYEFQTMIARLFDMDVSNASHYSGATAFADACLMATRINRKKTKLLISDLIHPEYINILRTTYIHKDQICLIPSKNGCIDQNALHALIDDSTAAIAMGYPNCFGIVEELTNIVSLAHDKHALAISVTPEPLALSILQPPGAFDIDIAVGEGLSFGLPVNFGGPSLGLFTVKKKFVRQMPGRVCGKTVDANNNIGYVLTLSTREQHIRREKATSNICSNQAHCATTAAIYLAALGKNGLIELGKKNAFNADYAREKLSQVKGISLPYTSPIFNEFIVRLPKPADQVIATCEKDGLYPGIAISAWQSKYKNDLLICCTELNDRFDIKQLIKGITNAL